MFERISSNSIRLFSEKENGSLIICYPFSKEKIFIEREEYKKVESKQIKYYVDQERKIWNSKEYKVRYYGKI